jgi:hypothetical protein
MFVKRADQPSDAPSLAVENRKDMVSQGDSRSKWALLCLRPMLVHARYR